jgi:hypothetical protein
MLRDAIYKAEPPSRSIILLAGLGHAATVLLAFGFTLIGFYGWISPFKDGIKTGTGIIIGLSTIPGTAFAAAIAIWGYVSFLKINKERNRKLLLRGFMSWYTSNGDASPIPQSKSSDFSYFPEYDLSSR